MLGFTFINLLITSHDLSLLPSSTNMISNLYFSSFKD